MALNEEQARAAFQAGLRDGDALRDLPADARRTTFKRLHIVRQMQSHTGPREAYARKLSDQHGVSCNTILKWLYAYQKHGAAGLVDRRYRKPSSH